MDDPQSEEPKVVAFPGRVADHFLAAKARVTSRLIQHTLIESYDNFRRHGKPYPFPAPNQILPWEQQPAAEQRFQNTALVLLLDGQMPRSLNKHFRLRNSNRVTWSNIKRLASPVIVPHYKAEDASFDHDRADDLLARLSTLDYALMLDREILQGQPVGPARISHMHVKVERLTDNAIKQLGIELGYLERRLFERGEDFVEALETKFFEYHGFGPTASGRKGAAAMATQLLSAHLERFSVFVSSQEDCRLTVLDETSRIRQHMLLAVPSERLAAIEQATGHSLAVASEPEDDLSIVVFRLELERTPEAFGRKGGVIDHSLTSAWLRVAGEYLIDGNGEAVPFSWLE
ncbi:hypothetical protein [Oceanibacterium hippocampi]|uniref:Uncharacterized protein n=1 Tax=Oceanibacterium hippocampi TaxID=745714 RepID=A0A1Y5RP42_9PROT|nr:hypothetical protein [Oceanibacterium hippocampi]SLN20889.1 hypothetical protein OCH7691_00515 [Oceanibacterium hippocampi]